VFFRIFTLLAVVALAISTWILSSPAHRPKPVLNAAEADMPGYYLKDAVLTDYDAAGVPLVHLEAQRIDQIGHGSEVALSNVRVNYQAPSGQNWMLVGDFARLEPGGHVIDVTGNVRLQGDSTEHAGTAIVHTDAMSYNVPESIASAKGDVRIDFGAHTLSAHGLIANLKERTMRLESKVNGRFQP
jgi:lipopolysaccharide export system protein LptC